MAAPSVRAPRGGFGSSQFGHDQFGHVDADYEPRFLSSVPMDESIGVSVFATTILFNLYCFSSVVQIGDRFRDLSVMISEDGGDTWSYAYRLGAWNAPYNGGRKLIDACNSDPHMLMFRIHKTSSWPSGQQVRVRVTAFDEYGNEATKEIPVQWPPEEGPE